MEHSGRTTHSLVVSAAAERIYGLVADAQKWPTIFGPSLHIDQLEKSDGFERFQLWALVNGGVATWTSRRLLDTKGLRITFEQERSELPITSMGGEWIFHPLPAGGTRVVLTHHFTVLGNDESELQRISSAVDRNSLQELSDIQRLADSDQEIKDLIVSFEDSMLMAGDLVKAYSFMHRSDLWPARLSHVQCVMVREMNPDVQELDMETTMSDGSAHRTTSIRICFEPELIVYKQLLPPKTLLGHSGFWRFIDTTDGVLVTAGHSIALDPIATRVRLEAGESLSEVRDAVVTAVGANSRATLRHAANFVGSLRSEGDRAGTS